MNLFFSTRQAARKLGIDPTTLSRYIAAGKVPAPKLVQAEGMGTHAWTEEEIEHVRQLLPKIANGRKTRYLKKKKNPQPGAAVPHKQTRSKKKSKR